MMRSIAPEAFRYWLTLESMIHGCSLLIPKKAFSDVGGFDESLRTTQDYDLWFRMAKEHSFLYVPGCLVKSRCHPDQGSVTMSALVKQECNQLLSKFVMGLTKEEVLQASQQSLSMAYANMAISIWRRHYFKPGWLAARLSCKHFSQSFRNNAKVIKMLILGILGYGLAHSRLNLCWQWIPRWVRSPIRKGCVLGKKMMKKIIDNG